MTYLSIKRLLDVLFAAIGLMVAFPVMILIGVAIAMQMGRPILFKQRRLGRYGKAFQLIKFRTMATDTDDAGQPAPDAVRLTGLGSLLRRSSLDELPQLWNVLIGHMSLVGPRPLFVRYTPYYTPREWRRHEIRPGITGLAQINEIDMSTPELLAKTDAEMIRTLTTGDYFKYIFQTVAGKGSGDRVVK